MINKITSFLNLEPAWKKEKIIILLTLGIFFILMSVNAFLQPSDWYGADGKEYLALGEHASKSQSLVSCHNFHHVYWSPGWVMVIGVLFKIFGPVNISVRIFLICCAILSAFFVYKISRNRFGFMPTLIVVVLFLLSTLTFRFTVNYQYEVFVGCLISSLTFILIKSLKSTIKIKNILCSFLAGIICAYASITSGKMILLVVVFIVISTLYFKQSFMTKVVPAIVVFTILMSIWIYRNYNCYNEFIPLTSNGGINLYIGNNPHSTLGYSLPEKESMPAYGFYQSSLWMKEAKTYIINNPYTTIKRMLRKMGLFFHPYFRDQTLLILLFLIGLIKFVRNRKYLNILDCWIIAPPMIFWAVHIVFFYEPRFIVPVWPVMAIIAASSMRNWKNNW